MKICPKCNKGMKKALQVVETEVTWWDEEGYYVAKPDGEKRVYDKCLICGTELQKMDPAKAKVGIPPDFVSLLESPNFHLSDHGQILGQTSESFDDLVIKWIEITKISGLRLGHGAPFCYPGGNGMVIAFIDGFGWFHKTENHVNVFILSAKSELWGSYTDNPQKILRTLRECVHRVLREKCANGIIKDKIYCLFNA